MDSFIAIVPEGHEILNGLTPEIPLLIEPKDAQRFLRQFAGELIELPKYNVCNGQMITHRGLKIKGVEIECLSMQPLFTLDFDTDAKPVIDTILCCSSVAESALINGPPQKLEQVGTNEIRAIRAEGTESTDEKEAAKMYGSSRKPDPKKMTGLVKVPSTSYSRFDVTGFLKNPRNGIRAVVIARSTVVDQRAEIGKVLKPTK